MHQYRISGRRFAAAIGLTLLGATALPVTATDADDCVSIDPSSPKEARKAPEAAGTDVDFVTGGIGGPEARSFREVKDSWPLAITMVEREDGRDRFTARVHVELHDAEGQRVFCVDAAGPYLFISAPPGDYRISARSMDGVSKQREVSLAAGAHRPVTLVWE